MSDGEILRRFEGIDKRMDAFVTVDAWTRENEHARDRAVEVDRDCRERTDEVKKAAMDAVKRIEDRGQNTWVRVLGVLGVAATLVAAAWAAYMSSRGAH